MSGLRPKTCPRIRVALVNDFELVVRGTERMLRPAADRLAVVELDLERNPEQRVDVALFDPYGDPEGGLHRVRSLVGDQRVGFVAVYAWQIVAEHVNAFLNAGARGVLAKSTPAAGVADALVAIND